MLEFLGPEILQGKGECYSESCMAFLLVVMIAAE